MTQTPAPKRFPWVAASFVTTAAFVAIDYVTWFVLFPNVSDIGAGLFELLALLGSALSVGYLVRRRFEYPLRGIFITCIVTSFLAWLAVFSVLIGSSANTPQFGLFPWNKSLYPGNKSLSVIFGGSAAASIITGIIITAGAMLSIRAMAKRQIPPVNPQ